LIDSTLFWIYTCWLNCKDKRNFETKEKKVKREKR